MLNRIHLFTALLADGVTANYAGSRLQYETTQQYDETAAQNVTAGTQRFMAANDKEAEVTENIQPEPEDETEEHEPEAGGAAPSGSEEMDVEQLFNIETLYASLNEATRQAFVMKFLEEHKAKFLEEHEAITISRLGAASSRAQNQAMAFVNELDENFHAFTQDIKAALDKAKNEANTWATSLNNLDKDIAEPETDVVTVNNYQMNHQRKKVIQAA